jgi:hypothetical protein
MGPNFLLEETGREKCNMRKPMDDRQTKKTKKRREKKGKEAPGGIIIQESRPTKFWSG